MGGKHSIPAGAPKAVRRRLKIAGTILAPALVAGMSLGSAVGAPGADKAGADGASEAFCGSEGLPGCTSEPGGEGGQGAGGGQGSSGPDGTGTSSGGTRAAVAPDQDLATQILCDIHASQPIEGLECAPAEAATAPPAEEPVAEETAPAPAEKAGTPADQADSSPVSDPGTFSSEIDCGILSVFGLESDDCGDGS